VFLALPHEESAKAAATLPAHLPVVDLSASFRLTGAAAWARYYQTSHAGTWAYGLPELPGAPGKLSAKEQIKAARAVAAPGCYATTSILALAPLLHAGLVEPADIVVVAASGTSGAGRSLRYDLLASEVMGSMSAYKVGGTHRHTPEIEQALAEVYLSGAGASRVPASDSAERAVVSPGPVTLSFTPTLAPMPRGILATSTAKLAPALASHPDATSVLRAAFADAYASSPFVHLLPEGQWPVTAAVYGSNGAHVQVAADPHAGRAVVISTTDNLGKGAAGQAVQIANLMLGLPETAGLTTHGVSP
jgi:N-acetyl-gamma-glutamyl-phosphate reductase